MHRLLLNLSRVMAVLGGLVLGALVLLTVVSVSGRLLGTSLRDAFWQGFAPDAAGWLLSLGIGPVNGDVELTEAGIAFAIFAFLPLTHITAGHASVDVFTSRFSPRLNRILAALTAVIFAGVMVLIAVQLTSGMLSKLNSGQTSFLIEFPVWWSYAACLPGAWLAAVVALWLGFARLVEMRG